MCRSRLVSPSRTAYLRPAGTAAGGGPGAGYGEPMSSPPASESSPLGPDRSPPASESSPAAPMRVLPAPSAVLLDLDGTLVDTVSTRTQAWLAALAEFGIGAERELVEAMIGVDGRRLARDVGEHAGVPMKRERASQIDARHGEIYAQLNTDPRPLPGVRELVSALEAAGVPWAIATSSGDASQVTASVSALELFTEPTVVDGSHVENGKPEPDLFLLSAERLAVDDTSRCWCVGDATWDMAAAVAAQMVPVGVTAGSAVDARRLRAAGAVRVVATLADLLPLPVAG